MTSTPMNQKKSSSTRKRSRTGTASSTAASRRRRQRANKLARACMSKRRGLGGGPCSSSSSSSSNDVVSEKLEALRNLIPVTKDGADDSAAPAGDELFQETAEYILRLRTQVVILQELVRFYGSTNLPEEQREINDASSVL